MRMSNSEYKTVTENLKKKNDNYFSELTTTTGGYPCVRRETINRFTVYARPVTLGDGIAPCQNEGKYALGRLTWREINRVCRQYNCTTKV